MMILYITTMGTNAPPLQGSILTKYNKHAPIVKHRTNEDHEDGWPIFHLDDQRGKDLI